ncbi:MAG: hypothetical protein U0S12_08380 [Fimbriimonadales bacterium]
MAEEQAILAELQRIADEVSEAFHGPKWKVVPQKWGNGFVPLSFFRRIQVGRAWLLEPDMAQFRFRVVLQRLYHEYHSRSVGYQIMLYSFLTIGFGIFLLPLDLHPLGISLNETVVNAALIHAGVFNFWLPYYDRKLRNSDAFLTRVLELSKDPEALRAHLLQEKASPETLAKFDATLKGRDQLAHG